MNTDSNRPVHLRDQPLEPPLPPFGAPVWVRCHGFRTMAYRDAKGAWRTVARDQELKEPVEVLED